MPVQTKKVTGRRTLHFNSLAEMLADAEQLAAARHVRALGNWTLAQALTHLGRTMNGSIDGFSFKAPWIIRLIGPLLKNRMVTRPMSAGFNLPIKAARELIPDNSVSLDEAMTLMRTVVHRLQTEQKRTRNAVLGNLTLEQWNQLHQRHAELHLSFFVPER